MSHDRPRANLAQFFLQRPKSQSAGVVTMTVGLGFGSDPVFASSGTVTMPAGVWHHLAFTYDGAGTVKIYFNCEKVGENSFPDRGPIAPSTRNLSLGERAGSTYQGFAGVLDDVCLRRGVRTYHTGNIDCLMSPNEAFSIVMRNRPAQLALLNNTGQDLHKRT